tara:strand:- start:717 stop:1820 length:1104 start_codon:yes stop_codon:yes gene_type:complete
MTEILKTNIDWQKVIEKKCLDLGFSNFGISTPDISTHKDFLKQWIESGFSGTMSWISKHAEYRLDPESLVPGTIRIICVTLNYLPPETKSVKILYNKDLAYISRYALGRDYHRLMRKRLSKLGNWINEEIEPHGYRVFSDSAPILEKYLGERSGLGWIGKNTLLLSRSAGSWFFLGELFTDLPIPPTDISARQKNLCGSCESCIKVCPTKAIVAPYKLDARKCISYLTIEHKGSIPEEFRIAIGNRIFGCDDCQLICPWNRYAKVGDRAFWPRHGLDKISLRTLFKWTEETFLTNTEGSPIRRAGYKQFIRNCAIGLGNSSPSRETIKILESRKPSQDKVIDEHISWAINRQNEQLKVTIENDHGKI